MKNIVPKEEGSYWCRSTNTGNKTVVNVFMVGGKLWFDFSFYDMVTGKAECFTDEVTTKKVKWGPRVQDWDTE